MGVSWPRNWHRCSPLATARIFNLVKMSFLPLVVLAIVLPQLDAFCLKQGCDKYFDKVKTDAKVTGACAVLFEENCCKSVGTFGDAKKLFVVPRGGQGQVVWHVQDPTQRGRQRHRSWKQLFLHWTRSQG